MIGPQRCLILARVGPGGKVDPLADGVVAPPGFDVPAGMLRAVEVGDAGDIGGDLLVLPPREITHRPLIEACALSGLPLLLCTAGATMKEIVRAVSWHRLAFQQQAAQPPRGPQIEGGSRIIVIHSGGNLRAMARILALTFAPVGYEGADAAAAVAAGAVMVILAGQDFAEVRRAEQLLGDGRLTESPAEHGRRAIVTARRIGKGETVAAEDLAFVPPGPLPGGFAPYQLEDVLQRKANRDIAAGEPIMEVFLEGKPPQPPEWFSPRPPRLPPG